MIEWAVPHTPTGRQAKQIRLSSQILLKLLIWVLEIVASALGTCIIFVATAFLQFGHETPPWHNDLTLLKVIGLTLVILMEYALTGYLATTLIARFSMRGRLQRFYPYVCAGLYLIHSTIFFVLAGNSSFRTSDLILQVAGACATFASTLGTNQLISKANERRRESEQTG
ncbi:hypothetical protein [Granulicella arctica]|uniref:hypothetical protein n=1 Tax=Granulicella arctica TaxID=940613 RepID=UPI0021DF8719|nr:hypothetical protein [Granulicella arctica]